MFGFPVWPACLLIYLKWEGRERSGPWLNSRTHFSESNWSINFYPLGQKFCIIRRSQSSQNCQLRVRMSWLVQTSPDSDKVFFHVTQHVSNKQRSKGSAAVFFIYLPRVCYDMSSDMHQHKHRGESEYVVNLEIEYIHQIYHLRNISFDSWNSAFVAWLNFILLHKMPCRSIWAFLISAAWMTKRSQMHRRGLHSDSGDNETNIWSVSKA